MVIMSDLPKERRSNDRFLAAFCHLVGLVPLFGVLVPAGVWLAMRADQPWLARQAARAASAQILLVISLLLIPGTGTLLSVILHANGAHLLSALVQQLSSFTLQAGLVFSWLMFAYAAIRVFQEGEFRYPVLTRALEGPPVPQS